MSKEFTRIYVHKYALSTGRIDARDATIDPKGYALCEGPRLFLSHMDYSLTPAEALAIVEEARIKKLQSLDKQAKALAARKVVVK